MTASEPPPRAVLTYGLLGILPFWCAPLAGLVAPAWVGIATTIESLYAALILSFLGGARWGLAVREPSPSRAVVGLSMLPTLAALAVLVMLHARPRLELLALAGALAICWAWDHTAPGLPPWYGRLRAGLTLGAVLGLCVSAAQSFL